MESAPPNPPDVAVVHQLARTGGTLVNRCLGSMRGVAVLSEVHPLDPQYKITRQASAWFALLGEADMPWLKGLEKLSRAEAYGEIVVKLVKRCSAQGRHLVLRDWTHLDFLGVPFVHDPPMRLLTEEALAGRCKLSQAFVVRHPLDQYASSASRPGMAPHLTPALFLEAYVAFARIAADRGFQRYEDIAGDPEAQLRKLCQTLQVPFDSDYKERWQAYDKLTGDNAGPSRGFAKSDIAPMPPMSVGGETLEALRHAPLYRECLELLGYADRSG